MTDGERLVWASSFSIALAREGDGVVAAQAAANAIECLREATQRRVPGGGNLAIGYGDTAQLLDEIVSVP